MRVVVMGGMVRIPIGGMTWHYLNYLLGFRELGHDVCYFEDSDDHLSCYDPSRHITDEDPSYGLRYAESVFRQVGLEEQWGYHDAHTGNWYGPCGDKYRDRIADADVLLNISGFSPIRSWLERVPKRVFIDTDPLFEQIRQLTEEGRRARALEHNAYLTFGENIGRIDTDLPEDGLDWIPTRQPIAMSAWPVAEGPVDGRYTTVMVWESYPPKPYRGVVYGPKSTSFEDYFGIPSLVSPELELAVGSRDAPRDRLRNEGWFVRDPLEVTDTPWSYRDYIRNSRAEFTVAKHGYVVTRSGWFSERSACYLASGRPVITQDTGFGDNIPTGRGLIAFSNPSEAVAAIEQVESDHTRHSRWARQVALEFFSAENVLGDLLHKIGF